MTYEDVTPFLPQDLRWEVSWLVEIRLACTWEAKYTIGLINIPKHSDMIRPRGNPLGRKRRRRTHPYSHSRTTK